MEPFKTPVVLTAELVVCRNQANSGLKDILGVKVLCMNTNLQLESGIFFTVDKALWPLHPKSPKPEKLDFTTEYSIGQLMRDVGFKELLTNICIL